MPDSPAASAHGWREALRGPRHNFRRRCGNVHLRAAFETYSHNALLKGSCSPQTAASLKSPAVPPVWQSIFLFRSDSRTPPAVLPETADIFRSAWHTSARRGLPPQTTADNVPVQGLQWRLPSNVQTRSGVPPQDLRPSPQTARDLRHSCHSFAHALTPGHPPRARNTRVPGVPAHRPSIPPAENGMRLRYIFPRIRKTRGKSQHISPHPAENSAGKRSTCHLPS